MEIDFKKKNQHESRKGKTKTKKLYKTALAVKMFGNIWERFSYLQCFKQINIQQKKKDHFMMSPKMN